MATNHTTAVLAQLRTALDLTDAEMQVAETRVQARTDAVRSRLGKVTDVDMRRWHRSHLRHFHS